jgi:hypothetical protein
VIPRTPISSSAVFTGLSFSLLITASIFLDISGHL